jgi:multidrug efflux pump subunit AcrB
LQQLQIPNRYGQMIPLNTLAEVKYIIGPRTLDRFNQSTSATVNVILLPGAISGDVMKKVKNLVETEFSRDYKLSWTDMSYQEDKNEGQILILFALSCLFAYLFLVAQYESWTIPIPVMLSVMFATMGGLFALNICDRALDIYAQLGLLMLIGLSAKSAILMVEFSMQQRAAGVSIEEAALNGANTRYRAVLMTALSFVIGVVPLMVATGAGSVSRRIIGITTGWGMIVATFIGIAFIPPLYYICQSVREKVSPHKKAK